VEVGIFFSAPKDSQYFANISMQQFKVHKPEVEDNPPKFNIAPEK